MEKAKQEAFDNARLQVIKDGYERAFECINRGLTEDERGRKERALDMYRQGRQHLLRAISVPSQGEECEGPAWDSARQMQRKMQETLNNITTRLAVLETTADSRTVAANGALGGGATQQMYPRLPSKEKPGRPPSPSVRFSSDQPAGAVGGVTLGGHGLPGEQPPAYSPQAADGHLSISYGTDSGEFSLVGDEFYTQASRMASAPQSLGEDGEELLFLPRGVQIFFVSPDGQVSAPSYPGYLRIVKFSNERSERTPNRPPAFLQVCDWLYPLMSRDSPVLLCNTGVFMFPDMMAPVSGSYVGVVLSSELPLSSRELFQDLLSQLTDLKVQAPGEPGDTMNLSQKVPFAPPIPVEGPAEEEKSIPEWSEKVAHGILTGASWLSWGLVKGAEYTGKAIHKGASKLREHITPEDKPAAVSPTVSKGLHVAKQATGGAVKVSQFLVDGVCMVAGCVGRELAPHVKKHGLKLIPESMKKDKDGKSTVDGALVVAASGVQGFATMWNGLEEAAKNIAKSVASETVTTVKYKEKQRSDKTVCILIIPELGSDIPVGAADFVLTQPVTVEKMEKVLRGCRLVTERGQSDSRCSMTGMLEPSRQDCRGQRRGEGASEHESSEGDDGGEPFEIPWRCDSPPVTESNMHALLHSQKEQRRRLQIKNCCSRLRELLPFVSQRLDIASILELTVSYVGYLQQRLPADILQKVVKTLEETKPNTWYKSAKAPRKRKHALKEKSTIKLTSADEDFADDFIAAHVLGRHIRPRTGTSLAPCPVMASQLYVPPLDLNPTSAHGAMWQPTCPPFSNPVLMTEACDPPEYIYQPPSIFLTGTTNATFAPQLSLDPNSSHPGMLNQFSSLPAVLDQNSSPLSGLDPACPSGPTIMMNKSFTVTAAPDELSNPAAVVTQPSPLLAAPESTAETSSFAPATSWMELLTSQLVHEPSSHVLPSYNPFFGLSNAPPPLQNPNPGFQLSPCLISSQAQWTSSESPHRSAMAHPPQCFSQDSVLLDSPHALHAQSLTSHSGMAHTSVETPRMESHSEHHTECCETSLTDANLYTDKDLTSVFDELVPVSFDSY